MPHMTVSKNVGFYRIFLEFISFLTLLFRKNEIVRNCEKCITWLFLNIHETLSFWKNLARLVLFGFGSKTYQLRASNALKAFFTIEFINCKIFHFRNTCAIKNHKKLRVASHMIKPIWYGPYRHMKYCYIKWPIWYIWYYVAHI